MLHAELDQTVNNNNVSVAVIGAGVVGLCTALEAQRKGCQVTLFDRDEPGLGASFGNAGYLATELIEPLSNPQTLRAALTLWLSPNGPLSLPVQYLLNIAPWLIRFIKAAAPKPLANSRQGLIRLNAAAVEAWQRCLADIGASEQILKSGYLLVWESPGKMADAVKHQRWLGENGVAAELVQGDRLAEMEPGLAGQISHALYFPDAHRVRDPYTLCRLLFASFEARGGVFIQQGVAQLMPELTPEHSSENSPARQVAVATEQSQYRFEKVIVCAGAWSKKLLRDVGLSVPLEAERGYHLTIPGAVTLLKNSIGSAERKFVMGPLDSGLRVVGISQLGGLKLGPFDRCFNILRHHSRQLLPGLTDPSLEVSEWMGHRPTLPDSLPVIDQHPQHRQLLFAFGHQHLGLTQAAITAELIIQRMQNEDTQIDLTPYRVTRF
ncbi:FAD-binding oxidoreductase [uncultured Amphritea sp.]|uniref:NAD(P)/FAD-dependent oxidoreductase n=1 Tax=uncultured Amphritea sp. TaxID=981605 RepID=UPI0026039A3F|nr:FAD-binding oxidoreductase [uncultured Amphritea sp.]